ncbi:hypothetical protein NDU88_003126 [Pleurodeles waltl]|uniref:Uncharacterized protein n=1 Tax=Pleurodeles waltl TaxID=8319 RepID=A0AAV7TMJ8_PLEWA|nr:hypothetical protein NDU88_003126 [Pleurodeles waltl]
MITDSFGGAAVFLGRCAARLLERRRVAKCAAGSAVCCAARLAATRAFQGWPLPCLLFTGGSGGTALCGWLLMVPKITKMPRTLRGKPSLEAIWGEEREETACTPSEGSNECSRKRSVARCASNGEIGGECCPGPCNIYPNSEDKTDTSSKRSM